MLRLHSANADGVRAAAANAVRRGNWQKVALICMAGKSADPSSLARLPGPAHPRVCHVYQRPLSCPIGNNPTLTEGKASSPLADPFSSLAFHRPHLSLRPQPQTPPDTHAPAPPMRSPPLSPHPSRLSLLLLLLLFFRPGGADLPTTVDAYFELLADYFDFTISESINATTTSAVDDPYSCLRRQYRARGGWSHPEDEKAHANLELLGVEGSGHHALHELINKETGNSHINWVRG